MVSIQVLHGRSSGSGSQQEDQPQLAGSSQPYVPFAVAMMRVAMNPNPAPVGPPQQNMPRAKSPPPSAYKAPPKTPPKAAFRNPWADSDDEEPEVEEIPPQVDQGVQWVAIESSGPPSKAAGPPQVVPVKQPPPPRAPPAVQVRGPPMTAPLSQLENRVLPRSDAEIQRYFHNRQLLDRFRFIQADPHGEHWILSNIHKTP